jgi:hypothetical protein
MRLALVVSLCVLSLSSRAFACSCVTSGECPGLGGERFPVFLGTVLAVSELPRTDNFAFLSSRKARVKVDESFGGLSRDVTEVDVFTGSGGGDCGISFRVGEVYLIFASVGEDGHVHAGICSPTRKIEGADAALRVLRRERDGQRIPSLAGQIAQYNRNFDGVLGTDDPKPLANRLVRVKANGRTYKTRSDADGLYAFYDLPSGRYDFAPDLPRGTTLSWFIDSDKPLALLNCALAPVTNRTSRFSRVGPFRAECSTRRTICCPTHWSTSFRLTKRRSAWNAVCIG